MEVIPGRTACGDFAAGDATTIPHESGGYNPMGEGSGSGDETISVAKVGGKIDTLN